MMLGHDISYLFEVLDIAHGETEDQLDDRLRLEAKELGILIEEHSEALRQDQEDLTQKLSDDTRSFKAYMPEYSRRSGSIDSRASQSTGLISHFSDVSKDPWNGHRRCSRASLSFRDYDAFVARGVPNGRYSLSFSTLTTPSNSTFSLPLSQPASPGTSPKKSFRRIRGLSMLRLHSRTGSDASISSEGCLHCPQDMTSRKRATHSLPCGHRLCTQALRNTVKAATEGKTGAVPSCCGKPIPGTVVEQVMTQEEQTALLDKLEQWDEAISIAASTDSSRRDSAAVFAQQRPGALNPRSRTVSNDSRSLTLANKERNDLDRVLDREDYRLVLAGQTTQRDRFGLWVARQITNLSNDHERLRAEMRRAHDSALEDLIERHSLAMSEAEDKQVNAEADLRTVQQQERRDNATALKHMEFYCAGVFSTGEPHNRQITPQDLHQLSHARACRDQMDNKHASQINVLRGEQSRRMRLRAQRQDREAQELKRLQRKEELELERTCTFERLQLDENVRGKQRKVMWRWELQMTILKKKIEDEMGVALEGRLPAATWSAAGKEKGPSSISSGSSFDDGPKPAEMKLSLRTDFAVRAPPQRFQISGGCCSA